MPWWLLGRAEEEERRRQWEEMWRRREEEQRRQEEERRRAEEERRRREEEERRRREALEADARAALRAVLVGSRFAPLVHGMLRWLAVLPSDVVRVSELAMRTTTWLREALNNPEARAGAVMLGAYCAYLQLVKEKIYRRSRYLVAYRVAQERARVMLRLLEDDAELGALCWTGRAIHTWVRGAIAGRKGGDGGRGRLGRLGVHYVYWMGKDGYDFTEAPPRVMLSQAWDAPVPWRAGATVEPPWGVV